MLKGFLAAIGAAAAMSAGWFTGLDNLAVDGLALSKDTTGKSRDLPVVPLRFWC
ncbi:hypothetical protein [Rhizobium fabae]|uniref:Uncharacterized protein n=1 Tax=Rhizobium fabae TaxID=573179 RepID=A0A7W6FHN8_9HYPH|nr:hypothetical protein [Rhizobium fabae]MBB3913969.1 hypothetical protein [Rhizobium fabae]